MAIHDGRPDDFSAYTSTLRPDPFDPYALTVLVQDHPVQPNPIGDSSLAAYTISLV